MKYTSTERQAKYDKYDRQYDRLLEMQDRWEDHNTYSLIEELQIQFEMLDLEEAKSQIDKCREERTISRYAHEMTTRAIRFQMQSLIDQLSAMVKERQAIISMKIG